MKITLELPDDTLGLAITAICAWTGTSLTMVSRQVFSKEVYDGAVIKLIDKVADDGQSKAD